MAVKRTIALANGRRVDRWRVRVPGIKERSGFTTKAEADRWEVEAEAALREGVGPSFFNRSKMPTLAEVKAARRAMVDGVEIGGDKITLAELVELWAPTLDHAEATAANYGWLLSGRILPTFGETPIGSISFGQVQGWVTGMVVNDGLATESARKALKILRQALEFAVRDGRIRLNPTKSVTVPERKSERVVIYLNLDDAMRVVEATPEHWRAVVLAGFLTGCRVEELAGLRWSRVRLRTPFRPGEPPKVTIDQVIADVSGRLFIKEPKNKEFRTITIDDLLADALVEHRKSYGEGEDGRVFTGERGGLMSRSRFSDRVLVPAAERALGDRLEGRRFTGHQLRHSHAAILAAQGWTLEAVSNRLGHSSIELTKRYYFHLFEGHDHERVAQLGESATEALQRVAMGSGWAEEAG